MSTLKVGDRIEVTNEHHSLRGEKGTIIECSQWTIVVEFDKYVYGHSYGGMGLDGYCWIINTDHVDKIGETLSKEERVLNKCKHLWNKSKYVETFKKAY